MDRQKIIESMEEIIQSCRRQLIENNESIMANIGNTAKLAFGTVKAKIAGTDDDVTLIDTFHKAVSDFEQAIKNKDKVRATQILDEMESYVEKYKNTLPS